MTFVLFTGFLKKETGNLKRLARRTVAEDVRGPAMHSCILWYREQLELRAVFAVHGHDRSVALFSILFQ